MSIDKQGLQFAGEIDIQSLVVVNADSVFLDIRDYLVELNIYEDIFSNCLHGTLQLSDSRNLIKELDIVGNETLIVKVTTPSFKTGINKQFRIYSVSDRIIVRDQNTQIYTLHFCSQEAIKDSLTPLYRSFKGRIDNVVQNIYEEYLATPRTYNVVQSDVKINNAVTELYQLNPTENSVKFVSPGWTPLQCINWLSSKSIPSFGKSNNYLFWETTQAFYFGNLETIFQINNSSGLGNLGKYRYAAKNVADGTDSVEQKMFMVQDVEIVKTTDHLQNYFSGYLANRLITLDVINKKYELVDYDHVDNFSQYDHTAGKGGLPLFAQNSPRAPGSSVKFYPVNPGLHTLKNNISEKISRIHGNRISSMMELNNFKLHLTVPGRTDAEVGSMMYFSYPDVSPNSSEDASKTNEDVFYSGNYLVTAIRHKINLFNHSMTMEIVKDSLSNKAGE